MRGNQDLIMRDHRIMLPSPSGLQGSYKNIATAAQYAEVVKTL